MRRFISFKIGDEPTEDGRIENGHLVVRLPADFPPDFRGQISVEFETADGMDNDCDGTTDETCERPAPPPA